MARRRASSGADEQLAVWTESGVRLPFKARKFLPGLGVPQLHFWFLFIIDADQSLAVRAEFHFPYLFRVPFAGKVFLTGLHIPHNHFAGIGSVGARQEIAIRAEWF